MTNNKTTHSLEIGTQLGDYTIQAILGRGAFGITYLAYDQNLNYLVAIKEYLPQELATRDQDNTVHPFPGEKESLFQYGLSSFLREAQTVAKFRHPNIVSIRGFFKKNETAYMVMEYEKGQTLKAYLDDHPNISEQRLLEIFCPINEGLQYVHKLNYIHRDIKPTNILIREDNSPVLLDFGTARDVINTNSEDLTQIFTKGYAPVEQCYPKLAKQGPWTDIYALGATLYYAITGHVITPSKDRSINDSYQPLVELPPYNEIYSAHFLQAIDQALSHDPNERPQSLEQWNNALKALIEEESPTPPTSTKTTLPSQLKNKVVLIPAIAVITLLIIGILYFSIFNTKEKNEIPNAKEKMGTNNESNQPLEQPSDSSEKDQAQALSTLKENNPSETEKKEATEATTQDKLPDDLQNIVDTYTAKLAIPDISFTALTKACDTINNYINQSTHSALRSIYIDCLEQSLANIPATDLDDLQKEWLKIHENNIIRDTSKGYKLNPEVKEEILNNPHLYGTLNVKLPKNTTLYLTIKQGNTCTTENPCEISETIKRIKIQSGETDISFSDANNSTKGKGTVNVHPNQDYQLVLEN
ncbi:MAG: serine/threonine protein kinase [bacterium]